jgi:hypothetical protein
VQNIIVGRYQHPTTRKYWQGWIEPEDRSWIAFIAADGHPVFYLDREESGAVFFEGWTTPDAFVRESETDPLYP